MTPQHREACERLVTDISGQRKISVTEFQRLFPESLDEGCLSLRLLKSTVEERDAIGLQCALVVGAVFGVGDLCVPVFCELLSQDWHRSHEDIVDALGLIDNHSTVEALGAISQRIPSYLQYDENRSLARKAIRYLSKLPSTEAKKKLAELAISPDTFVRGIVEPN